MTSRRNDAPGVLVYRSNFLGVSETFIRDHIVGLKRWRPVVIFKTRVGDAAERIDARAFAIYPSRLRRLTSWLMEKWGFNPLLSRVVRKQDIKILHAHFLHDGARMAAYCGRHDLPLVVTAHGYDATLTEEGHRQTANGRMLLEMTPTLQRVATLVLCVSDFIRSELVKKGWPPEKLRTVPLGVDLGDIRPGLPAAQRSGVVYVGRLVEKKGGLFLLQAMARLPLALRDTSLTVVGDGPLRGELESLAKQLGVNATFLGAQPRDVGLDLMGRAQVLALPSIRAEDGDAEGLPIVTMEAQARGCPLVMFDVGSASDAIADGRSGLLARDRDVDDLASKLASILSDTALAARLGENGPTVVRERFDLETNIGLLEAVYDAIAAAR